MEFNKDFEFENGLVLISSRPETYIEEGYRIYTQNNNIRWPLIDGTVTIENTVGAMQDSGFVCSYHNLRPGLLKLHSQVYEYMNATGLCAKVPLGTVLVLLDFDFSIDAMIVYDILSRLCNYGCSMPRIIVNDAKIMTNDDYSRKRNETLSQLNMDQVARYYSMLLFANINIPGPMPPLLESSVTRNARGQVVMIDKRVMFLATFSMQSRTLTWIMNWDAKYKEMFPMVAFCLLVESYEPILLLDETTHTYMNSGKYSSPVEYELAMVSQYIATFGTIVLNQKSAAYQEFCIHHHLDAYRFASYLIRLNRGLSMQLYTQYNNFNAKEFLQIITRDGLLTGVNKYNAIGGGEYVCDSRKIKLSEIAQIALPQSIFLLSSVCWISA